MTSPFPTGNSCDVQAEHRQGPDHDHTSRDVNPLPEEWGEDDGQCSSAEVERKFNRNACCDDVDCAADCKDDALQRASFRWGRVLRLLRLLSGAHSSAAGSADALNCDPSQTPEEI
jgi:hypothetical protein